MFERLKSFAKETFSDVQEIGRTLFGTKSKTVRTLTLAATLSTVDLQAQDSTSAQIDSSRATEIEVLEHWNADSIRSRLIVEQVDFSKLQQDSSDVQMGPNGPFIELEILPNKNFPALLLGVMNEKLSWAERLALGERVAHANSTSDRNFFDQNGNMFIDQDFVGETIQIPLEIFLTSEQLAAIDHQVAAEQDLFLETWEQEQLEKEKAQQEEARQDSIDVAETLETLNLLSGTLEAAVDNTHVDTPAQMPIADQLQETISEAEALRKKLHELTKKAPEITIENPDTETLDEHTDYGAIAAAADSVLQEQLSKKFLPDSTVKNIANMVAELEEPDTSAASQLMATTAEMKRSPILPQSDTALLVTENPSPPAWQQVMDTVEMIRAEKGLPSEQNITTPAPPEVPPIVRWEMMALRDSMTDIRLANLRAWQDTLNQKKSIYFPEDSYLKVATSSTGLASPIFYPEMVDTNGNLAVDTSGFSDEELLAWFGFEEEAPPQTFIDTIPQIMAKWDSIFAEIYKPEWFTSKTFPQAATWQRKEANGTLTEARRKRESSDTPDNYMPAYFQQQLRDALAQGLSDTTTTMDFQEWSAWCTAKRAEIKSEMIESFFQDWGVYIDDETSIRKFMKLKPMVQRTILWIAQIVKAKGLDPMILTSTVRYKIYNENSIHNGFAFDVKTQDNNGKLLPEAFQMYYILAGLHVESGKRFGFINEDPRLPDYSYHNGTAPHMHGEVKISEEEWAELRAFLEQKLFEAKFGNILAEVEITPEEKPELGAGDEISLASTP